MNQVAEFNNIDDPKFIEAVNSNKMRDISLYSDAKKSLDDAFTFACYWGHYDVARWLLMVKPEIKADFNYLFQISCQNGYLLLAKFLLAKRPDEIDITKYNNYAYRKAQENFHKDVCLWLYSLNPECILTEEKINAWHIKL